MDTYPKRAAALSDNQKKFARDLDGIHKKTPLKPLDTAFSQTADAMTQTATILATPQTGKPADDAEMAAIATLSDLINLINEQAQHPKSQPSQSPSESKSDEEMQFLMQMMRDSANAKAMSARPATGMNWAGGTTDRAGGQSGGKAAGKGADARDVRKAGGVLDQPPAEFRDALDNYYHGIDQPH
jgi:hypothetical protein